MIIQKKLIKPIENKGAVKLGSVATTDHNLTTNRGLPNQHSQEAITGLTSDLNTIKTDISDNSSAVSLVKDEITTLQGEIDAKPDKVFVEAQLANKADKTEIDTINVELEVNSTNISDNAANILLKADKTEIAAIDAAIELNTNNITKNTADILLKANETEITAIDAKLEINTNNITKNSGDILLKADKTELASKQDKLTAGTNITIADNVISASGGSVIPTNMMTTDTDQTITGIKSFDNGIKSNLIEVNGKDLVIKNSNPLASYITVEQSYTGSGYKNWFGFVFVRNISGTKNNLGALQVKNNENFWLTATNDLIINGVNIKFSNKTLQQVAPPINDTDAATKKYVDDAIKAAIKPKP